MFQKNLFGTAAIVAAISTTVLFPAAVSAQQYTGAGSTWQNGRYQQTQPASPRYPTETWQYKLAEKVTPIVGGVRDCAAGALIGSVGGPTGMALGCAGGVTPHLSTWRPLKAY